MTHPLSIHFQIIMKTPKICLGIVLVCFVSSGLAQEQEESNSTEVPTEALLNGKNETLAIEEELEETAAAAENSNQTARELRKVETGKSLIFQIRLILNHTGTFFQFILKRESLSSRCFFHSGLSSRSRWWGSGSKALLDEIWRQFEHLKALVFEG